MKKQEYNGWSNYATWKVNNDILVDIVFDQPTTRDYLEEIVEDVVFTNKTEGGLIEDFARAFIRGVDFEELENVINSDF
tara:strand:- start:945 stop:1181 length:237 start_codon:yes stop_codon:yes gene_type:complete